jgi:hypothetical protein
VKPILLYMWLRLKRAYDEIDYAQKRMLEINSGRILTPESRRRAARAEVEQLNALLAAEPYRHPVNKRHQSRRRRGEPHDDSRIGETG